MSGLHELLVILLFRKCIMESDDDLGNYILDNILMTWQVTGHHDFITCSLHVEAASALLFYFCN